MNFIFFHHILFLLLGGNTKHSDNVNCFTQQHTSVFPTKELNLFNRFLLYTTNLL